MEGNGVGIVRTMPTQNLREANAFSELAVYKSSS